MTDFDSLLGVHHDMPAEDYHAVEALSSSGIKVLNRSPAHFQFNRQHPKAAHDAYRIGTAIHTLVLEPHRAGEVIEMPTFNARSSTERAARDAWIAEHAGCQAFDAATLERIHGAVAAVRAHPAASALLSDGLPEVSMFWRDSATGVPCKCRVDFLRNDRGRVDLKSCADASADAFSRAIGSYQYHVQSAWYFIGAEHIEDATPPFWSFVCVETEAPFGVATYALDAASIRAGMTLCSRALRVYAECLQSGRWPSYPETVEPISAPRWALREVY